MDILIPEGLAVSPNTILPARFKVVHDPSLWKSPAGLMTQIRGARTLMVRNQTQVTADLLTAAPNLLAVGRLGVGLDNIDLEAATKLGIVVIAPLNANATSVAELTLGLLLSLARRIPYADRSTKRGAWDRQGCMGVELEGKTLAICGFGRIGRLVATRAQAFGLRVIVFDPFLPADAPALAEPGLARCESLAQALAQADFVTVHCPATPETKGMFGASAFAAMKPGACLINTSRGTIVDEPALARALESGRLSGAALDVRETEPPVLRTALEKMDNVILAPHIGAATSEAQARTFHAVAEDLGRVLDSKPALNFVNFPSPQR